MQDIFTNPSQADAAKRQTRIINDAWARLLASKPGKRALTDELYFIRIARLRRAGVAKIDAMADADARFPEVAE